MRVYAILVTLLIASGCSEPNMETNEKISLAGEWGFIIDSLDQGVIEKWYNNSFSDKVKLPGSMAENGKGYEVSLNTEWTGDIIDQSYFTADKYSKYRETGNIKIPFWLKPVKYYKGVAWYQKTLDIPEDWSGKRVILFLERCHWETTLFVNGEMAGTDNSLSTPHEYDITGYVKHGSNNVSIRVDNRIIIPIGVNSHSISDHTQSNWNGISGEISLRAISEVSISDIRIYPDTDKKVARVIVNIKNPDETSFTGKLRFSAESFNTEKRQKLPVKNVTIVTNSDEHQVILDYKIQSPQLWSEFSPAMYKLNVELRDDKQMTIDSRSEDFGMRKFSTNGTRFEVNGIPVFLRGTTECCIFPLTGYPPSDYSSWERVLKVCREYGLNHVRFHSYCPPEAAFEAADRLGIYFQIECSSWANQGASIGNDGPVDRFIYEEGDRILREYGNHPSFCMLAYGNEPAGRNQNAFLGQLINYWKSIDNRRIYTSAAGWPVIPESDYHVIPEPRIQQWGQGLKSIINREAQQTMFDFRDIISKYTVPVISHEIGQWCVYPDFKEIEKYSGVLKPSNFEIFRETLSENGMGGQAEDFLMASGKLQVLCYKADIEAALRTPGFAGFELLQLHDFPGQGTALVGILNPFFESKGYVSPEEFRMFCNETVPLARIEKMVFRSNETFKARVEFAHFGPEPLKNKEILCRVTGTEGEILGEEVMTMAEIPVGNGTIVGEYNMDLKNIVDAQKLRFEVSVPGTSFQNGWDFWVYPAVQVTEAGDVLIAGSLDKVAEEKLRNGGSVLLFTHGKVVKGKGAEVAIGFSSIFWNTAWTNNQAPHTLGILCDPKHPAFKYFPTEFHTNSQWWDPVYHSQAMILDGFPSDLKPIIQPIDTWFENRRLALAFEARAGNGKLLVCSINMTDDIDQRPVSKQLLSSILRYMNSSSFTPDNAVALNEIRAITGDRF